jgi:hypothetical protein
VSCLRDVATNALERLVLDAFLALDYQRFGSCCCCRRVEDEHGRSLWVAGRVQGALVCFECFDDRGAPGRRLAA